MARTARIVGIGLTSVGKLPGQTPTQLMQTALEDALGMAGVGLHDVDGVIAVPSLSHPHFMEAHHFATRTHLLPNPTVQLRTIDTGGAGPVSALISARRLVREGLCSLVAVVAGDAVRSMPRDAFLERADQTCQDWENPLPSPVIPHGYDRVAQWAIRQGKVTREQLAMCSVLMSVQAARTTGATPWTLDDVLSSPQVAPVTTVRECAQRADGGAAFLVASDGFVRHRNLSGPNVVVLAGGEGSGPLQPPPVIDESMFSCEVAAHRAFESAQLGVRDIDFFGLYDCFPICLVRAIEAVGLAKEGEGGQYIQERYEKYITTGTLDIHDLPVNTHGGLLAFGAPWETPAMYNIMEGFRQLTGTAGSTQLRGAQRALVYGNGGIFSHSAVALLGKGVYD